MLPNFIVAGVAKAGTTSLYYYLIQHPEIDIPRKEVFYFAKNFFNNIPTNNLPYFRDKKRLVLTEEDYDAFYSKCSKKAVGEVSTCYAYFYASAIPLIKGKLGDIPIIFLLRNPVERAFSAYMHFRRDNKEELVFADAIKQESERMEKHWDFMWYYIDLGFYSKQVKAYKDNFTKVKIITTDDLTTRPEKIMKDLFDFLAVDNAFKPDLTFRYNSSEKKRINFPSIFFSPVFKKITTEKQRKLLKQRIRISVKNKSPLSPGLYSELLKTYREDILTLEKITDLDFSSWIKTPS
jgi:hypothetical protein